MATNDEELLGDTSTLSEAAKKLDTDDVMDRYERRGPAGHDIAGSPRPDRKRRGGRQPRGADKPERHDP
jgi:hypothetical protein